MKRLPRSIINAIELGVDLLGLYGASFSDSPNNEQVILPIRVLLDDVGLGNLPIPSDRETRSRFVIEVTMRLAVAGKQELADAVRLGYALCAYDETVQAESGTALYNLIKLASKVGVAESSILALVKERTSIHQADQAEVLLSHIHSWLEPEQPIDPVANEENIPERFAQFVLKQDQLEAILGTIKVVQDQSKYNFPNVQKVQIFEQVNSYIENNNPVDPDSKQALADLKQLIADLQQKYPQATEKEATAIIDAEFKEIQRTQRQRWQNLLSLKRLWNGVKKGSLKAGEHFAEETPWGKAVIGFLEGVTDDAE